MVNKVVKGKTYLLQVDIDAFDGQTPILYGEGLVAKIHFVSSGNDIVVRCFEGANFVFWDGTTMFIQKNGTNYNTNNVNNGWLCFSVESVNENNSVNTPYKERLQELTSIVEIQNQGSTEWKPLPCPSSYNGTSTTLVDSARNTKGVVIGQIVRSDIAKVEMSWNFLTNAEYARIAQMFEEKYGGSFFFKAIFFNAVLNAFDMRDFYPNDRKFQTAKMVLKNGVPQGYQNVGLNIIEV